MITVGTIVTPRLPMKASYADGPALEYDEGAKRDVLRYSREIVPGQRFTVFALRGDTCELSPYANAGHEHVLAQTSELEPWTL